MILFEIIWNYTKILFSFIPVFFIFLLSWMLAIPQKPINALNPLWHFSLLVQHLIYLTECYSYTKYNHLMLAMFILERSIYMAIYKKYSNVHEQVVHNQIYYSIITNVIPYSILNFLIAIPFFLFYSGKVDSEKTNNFLLNSGFTIYGLAVMIAIYKFWQILVKRPSATNLNAILFSDVLSTTGLFVINCSMGRLATVIFAFLNYIAIRASLGRPLFYKGKDFVPADINVIPKVIIR